MKKKVSEKRNPKKGANAIEVIIGMLIFMLLFGFFFDMFNITTKQFSVDRQIGIVSRTIAVQGGVKRSAPSGYSANETYLTATQLHGHIGAVMRDINVLPGEYSVRLTRYNANNQPVSTRTLTATTEFEVDYEQRFEVEIQYSFKWKLMGQLVPGMGGTRTATRKRSNVSEYRYRVSYAPEGERGNGTWLAVA